MSREYTKEEVRNEFLDEVRGLVKYWRDLSGLELQERLDGLAFSILTVIDGDSQMPAFALIPLPNKEDKDYHIENEDNYYPYWEIPEDVMDLGGGLHEHFYKKPIRPLP